MRHTRIFSAVLAVLFCALSAGAQYEEVVIPFVDCVTEHGDGTYTAWFGYDNPNDHVVTIAAGSNNRITG